MTTYTTIANSEVDAESPCTESLFTRLRDNPIAITEGSSGAPKIQEAAMDTASINQAALKTTTGSTSTTTGVNYTLPGGEYGFFFQIRISTGSGTAEWDFWDPGASMFYTTSTTFTMGMRLERITTGTAYVQQRYIQSSPPYNLGDGEVPLFIFAIVDKNGKIESVSVSPDPPWANNGPTNIRPTYFKGGIPYIRRRWAKRENGRVVTPIEMIDKEIEITIEYKNTDMSLIPHPFQGNDLKNKTIVLIDPSSDICCKLLEVHESEESVNELFHEGYLLIDNEPLKRKAPPECVPVKAKWKLTV